MDLNFDEATRDMYGPLAGFEHHRRWDKVLFDARLSVRPRGPKSRPADGRRSAASRPLKHRPELVA